MRFLKQCLQALLTSHFSLPDPARHPPAFSIIPTDRESGTGYIIIDDNYTVVQIHFCFNFFNQFDFNLHTTAPSPEKNPGS